MRQSVFFRFGSIATALLLVAGCASREAPAPRPAPPVVVAPPSQPVSTEDYMKISSSRALLVVRASDLAMTRSSHSGTRQLAARLKRDHTGIAAQLNMAGRRLNLLPSASMLRLDQVMFDGLTRASDFDVAYRRTMRSAVENCISSHAAYAQTGGSPTLRPVARFAAAACRDELPLVRAR
jgi:predicted outer membrane protein